jgi:hypothetical protein
VPIPLTRRYSTYEWLHGLPGRAHRCTRISSNTEAIILLYSKCCVGLPFARRSKRVRHGPPERARPAHGSCLWAYNMIMSSSPSYLPEVAQYIEDKLENPTAVIAAITALLGDPETYGPAKGRPTQAFTDFVHELLLRDRELGEFIRDQDSPISRTLIKGKWSADWRGLRRLSAKEFPTPKFDVCISFAGEDREVAAQIAGLSNATG